MAVLVKMKMWEILHVLPKIDYFVADFSLEQFISDFEVHYRIKSIHVPF